MSCVGILNTFGYLLEMISPVVGLCLMIRTYTFVMVRYLGHGLS